MQSQYESDINKFKNFQNLKIQIKSRDQLNQEFSEPLILQFNKINLFEYGFELTNPQHNPNIHLRFKILKNVENKIQCRLYTQEDLYKVIAINGRGNPEIKLGYNTKGDLIEIVSVDELPLKTNTIEKVYIKIINNEKPSEFYWWGRQNNEIKGFKDIEKKTPFFIYISQINQSVIFNNLNENYFHLFRVVYASFKLEFSIQKFFTQGALDF